jgi:hypothetical protein
MKITAIVFLALAIGVASLPALGQDMALRSSCELCIDETITKYEHKSMRINSHRPAIARDAAIAHVKADYFKTHKEQLLKEMVARNLGAKNGEMQYFLVKSFGDHMGQDLDRAVAELLETKGEGLGEQRDYEAYSEEKE